MDFSGKPFYLIQLTNEGNFPVKNNEMYILKEKNNLCLSLSSDLLGKFVPCLLTNLPRFNEKSKKFVFPNSYNLASPQRVSRRDVIDKYFTLHMGTYDEEGTWYVEIALSHTGPLFMQILFLSTVDDLGSELCVEVSGKAEWIQVHPRIDINGKELSYRQLSLQSVLPRSMGLSDHWRDVLKSQASLGYNAFHFAPVQSQGITRSHYSIFDQLDLETDLFKQPTKEERINELRDIIKFAEKELNSLSFVDIVLNHTAKNSQWILDMPESYYSPENTPSLRSAFVLDLAVSDFCNSIIEKKCDSYPKGNIIENEEDVNLLMQTFKSKILPSLAIPSYFTCEIKETIKKIREELQTSFQNTKLKDKKGESIIKTNIFAKEDDDILLEELQKLEENLGAYPDGVTFNIKALCEHLSKNASKYSFQLIEEVLHLYNDKQVEKVNSYLEEATNNISEEIKYRFVKLNRTEVLVSYRLTYRYFNILSNGQAAANNGWIKDAIDFENFAVSKHFHYLRRNISVWGDCIKLNYGMSKRDSPRLWKRMKEYVRVMASIFHGFRIDNAHSTPLHVGEYLLRKARKVNPSLHIFCELFMNSSENEAIFVKRLGSNALMREAIHCKDVKSLIGSFWEFGDVRFKTVGSLELYHEMDRRKGKQFYPLMPRRSKALFFDQTHDNSTYELARTFIDCLPMAALMAFCNVFSGSTRGFDEFYQDKVSVINEKRVYAHWNSCEIEEGVEDKFNVRLLFISKKESSKIKKVELRGSWDNWATGKVMSLLPQSDLIYETSLEIKTGEYQYKYLVDGEWISLDEKEKNSESNHILKLEQNYIRKCSDLSYPRTIFHKYKKKLYEKYQEIYLEEKSHDVITVLRESSSKKTNYTLIVRNAYIAGVDDKVDLKVYLPGRLYKIKFIFTASTEDMKLGDQNCEYLMGNKVDITQESSIEKFADIFFDEEKKSNYLHFTHMPPSFVCLIKSKIPEEQQQALDYLEQNLLNLKNIDHNQLFEGASVSDINFFLFSCQNEEKEKNPKGCYNIPGKGVLPYQGWGGYFDMIKKACLSNDLGIPIFNNLREGRWLLDHLIHRQSLPKSLGLLTTILSEVLVAMCNIPYHNIPHYFAKIVIFVKDLLEEKVLLTAQNGLAATCKKKLGSSFSKKLLLAQYQFLGIVPSASPVNLEMVTVAAGLPHFSVGCWRFWGRDTFISFKGLFLISGLFKEGRNVILVYAACLRHGLLPNLIDRGLNPRYNCRDSVWWFIKAVEDYVDFTRDFGILSEKIKMRFLDDNQAAHLEKVAAGESLVLTLTDVLQRILQAHAKGISFTEWNAGSKLDWNMDYLGFNISLRMDQVTGFIFGGNPKNCLTWMDKMGSSSKAGTRGVPANSRDGAPIEMTALLKRALDFVIKLNNKGVYPYKGVDLSDGNKLLFDDWRTNIMLNFETKYYIPPSKEEYPKYDINPNCVKRRGMYKDVYKGTPEIADYYLRPNACIAMSVAPELFTTKYAEVHLDWVKDFLLERKSIGIKTLDPAIPGYVSYYNNSDDSNDKQVAHGFSYHNGPEWVWVYAYYVKAILTMQKESGSKIIKEHLLGLLSNHKNYLENNEWYSLPEMTNGNGEICGFSCPAQAWSVSCMLEACFDILNE